MRRTTVLIFLLGALGVPTFSQEEATPEVKESPPMDMIVYKSGTVFQGQIVEGKKTLIDDPNRYEIVLDNGQTVSIEDTGQIETVKMDGQVLNDPLRHGGRGRLLEMIEDYHAKQAAARMEREKSRLTGKVTMILGEPEMRTPGEESPTLLKVGDTIPPGKELRCNSSSRIQVRVAGQFTIALEQGALLSIKEISFGETEQDIVFDFDLTRGNVWIEKEIVAENQGSVKINTAGFTFTFPNGLKLIQRNFNGDFSLTNYEGPTLEVDRSGLENPINLARRTQLEANSLMMEGERAMKPEISQVGDPIGWYEFNVWKPVQVDLPVQFTLTRQDKLAARPVHPLMGVSSEKYVFQDLQPLHVTGMAPLLLSYWDALSKFQEDTGRLPSPVEGLAVLRSASGEIDGWSGPYLNDDVPDVDPWGHPLEYSLIHLENRTLVNLYSLGENGIDEQGLGDDLR